VGQEEMFMCTYLLFLSSVENTGKEGGKCDADEGERLLLKKRSGDFLCRGLSWLPEPPRG
jgi:hypothetical protein